MTEHELTKKIVKNANRQAKAMITAAEAQAQTKIAAAQSAADERQTQAMAQAQARLKQRQTQQTRAQEVEQIKAQIDAKQAVIEQVFATVRANLIHAEPETIKRLANHLIDKYARAGDQILVAANWGKALPQYPTTPALAGGLIIENATYRWELSIDAILEDLRTRVTPEIARILGV